MVLRWCALLLTVLLVQPTTYTDTTPVQFIVPEIVVSPSNTIDLPVTIQTNNNPVGSLEFELNYNQQILQFSQITVSQKAQQWLTYTMDGGNGKVRWGGYDTTYGQHTITQPTELFVVTFTVLDPNWAVTPITVGRKTAGDVQGWDIAVLNTDGYINQNRLGLPLSEDGIYGKAYPIPTNDIVTLEASLPVTGHYDVVLYDLTGKILDQYNKLYPKGMTTVTHSLSNYPSGTYLLQITNNKFAKTFKLIKN